MRFMLWYLGMALLLSFYLEAHGHDATAVWLLGVAMMLWALLGVFLALRWMFYKAKAYTARMAATRPKGDS